MTVHIREHRWDDADYAAVEAVEKAVWPNIYETANEHRDNDREHQAHYHRRALAEIDGAPVGHIEWMEIHWSETPHEYLLVGCAIPSHQGQGIGAKLTEMAMAGIAEQGGWERILIPTREDKTRAIRFLENRGYALHQRSPVSVLQVETADLDRFAWAAEKMSQLGIRIVNLETLDKEDPAWQIKALAMRNEVRQDVPSVLERKPETIEDFQTKVLEASWYDPRGYVIAIAPDGDYIGLSYIAKSEANPEKLYTNLTGTKRGWRRKGIATAMKIAIIRYALANNIKEIETDNEENNPMYDLNMQLGFKPSPADLVYEKKKNERNL